MRRKPKRFFSAEHIANGVKAVGKLQQKALAIAPTMAGPMARVPTTPPPEEMPEVLEGHCMGCKGKSKFEVEGEEKMKNGAIRKYGKCQADGCGGKMNLFVSGAKEGTGGA